jgi:hypothetical protein
MNRYEAEVKLYLNSISEKEIDKLFEQIVPNHNKIDISYKKENIRKCIFHEYKDFQEEAKMLEQEIKNTDNVTDFIKTQNVSKIITAYNIYNLSKFYKSATISDFLKILGVRSMYQKHLVNMDLMHQILFEIIKKGVLVNYRRLMELVDIVYEMRIYYEFRKYLIEINTIDEYDGQYNVPLTRIELNNIKRKIKYKSNNPKKPTPFQRLITPLLNGPDRYLMLNTLDAICKQDNYSVITLKFLLNQILNHAKIYLGRQIFLGIFKEYFQLLFPNEKYGLLNEESFEIIDKYDRDTENVITGKYDFNYKKYYSTRIKTLTGL